MKKLLTILLLALVVTGMLFANGGQESQEVENQPFKIGVIYVSAPGDFGYSYMHDQGTKAVKEKFGDKVKIVVAENIAENESSQRMMENMIAQGCKLIFANSYNYQTYMQNAAKDNPEVLFEHCSGYLDNENMHNYFGKMYQIRYLSGMIAGSMTKTNKIGYVAAYNTPEVVRGINAFTLGARRTNPKAEVRVVWTNTWFNPSLEREGAISLLDAGCDVIAQHQDTTEPAKAAIDRGAYAVGYNADFSALVKEKPENVLCSPIWHWGAYMIPATEHAMNGTWKDQPKAYWGGIEDGIVDLSPISPLVSEEIKKDVAEVKQKIKDGQWDVFWGELKDNDGNVKQKAGEKMSDGDMLTMQWFVDGVIGNVK